MLLRRIALRGFAGCMLLGCGGAPGAPTPVTAAEPVEQAKAPSRVVPAPGVAEVVYQCTEGAVEDCNGLDSNCNGVIDEGCGYATGALQVTASWNTPADVRLLVAGPDGARLHHDHRGRGACAETPVPTHVENVYVPERDAKAGTYQVEVMHADACEEATQAEEGRPPHDGSQPTAVSVSIALEGRVHGPYNLQLSPATRRAVASVEVCCSGTAR